MNADPTCIVPISDCCHAETSRSVFGGAFGQAPIALAQGDPLAAGQVRWASRPRGAATLCPEATYGLIGLANRRCRCAPEGSTSTGRRTRSL